MYFYSYSHCFYNATSSSSVVRVQTYLCAIISSFVVCGLFQQKMFVKIPTLYFTGKGRVHQQAKSIEEECMKDWRTTVHTENIKSRSLHPIQTQYDEAFQEFSN
jgi:hypothetical protein